MGRDAIRSGMSRSVLVRLSDVGRWVAVKDAASVSSEAASSAGTTTLVEGSEAGAVARRELDVAIASGAMLLSANDVA